MKKAILKFVLLSVLSIFLVYETICSYHHSDPWGLTFSVLTIPLAILSIVSIYHTIKNFKELIQKKDNSIECKTFKLIYIFPVFILLLLFIGVEMYSFYSSSKQDKIPENYIAVFNQAAAW